MPRRSSAEPSRASTSIASADQHERDRIGRALVEREREQPRDQHRPARVGERAAERPQDRREEEKRRERQVAAAGVPGDESAGGDEHRAQQLLGAVAAAVADQRARAQRAGDEVGEDPDLHRGRRRQPPERQQEDRPRERRLRVLVQHQAAAMVGVPGRELVEVGERHARRFPGFAEVAPVAGRAEVQEARPAPAPATGHEHRRRQPQRDRQAPQDREAGPRARLPQPPPGPPTAARVRLVAHGLLSISRTLDNRKPNR